MSFRIFEKKTNGHFTEKRNAGCLSMCGNHLSEPKVGAYQLAYAPVRSGNDLPKILISAYQFVSIFVLTDKNGMYLSVLLVRSYHFCDTYLLLYILKNMVGAYQKDSTYLPPMVRRVPVMSRRGTRLPHVVRRRFQMAHSSLAAALSSEYNEGVDHRSFDSCARSWANEMCKRDS